MAVSHLECRECKAQYALEALYVCEQCFGPLEVAYAERPDADPAELRRRIQAGPHSLWRYGDFLPVRTPPKGTLPAGWPLAPAMRPCAWRCPALAAQAKDWVKEWWESVFS